MAFIRIKTEIDITNSGVRRENQGDIKSLNQFRNYSTFLQALGLRTNFEVLKEPVYNDGFWVMEIQVSDPNVYKDGDDPIGLLKQDMDHIPIILGLNETAEIKTKTISTCNGSPNTFIEWFDK